MIEEDKKLEAELLLEVLVRISAIEQALIKNNILTENSLGEQYLVCSTQLKHAVDSAASTING